MRDKLKNKYKNTKHMKTKLFFKSDLTRLRGLVVILLVMFAYTQARGTTVTYTFSNSSWNASPANWTNITSGSGYESDRGVANNGVNGACMSPVSYSGGVSSIVVVASSNTTGGKVTIKIGSTTIATKDIANSNNVTYTYNSSDYANIATLSGNVKLEVTKPTSKTLWVKSVAITYSTEKYTVTYNAGSGTCGTASAKQTAPGTALTLPSATPNSNCIGEGWLFAGWKRTSAQTETTTVPTMYAAGASYVPEADETLYAVYRLGDYYSIDFESATSAYTDWTFSNATSAESGAIFPHGGSKYGTTGGKTSAYIVTKNKIEEPQSIRFYISKTTTNTTATSWKVQTSENGSVWTDRKSQEAQSMGQGEWVEVTQDLSSYTNVYVRIYYDGGSSTAMRAIDDAVLSCATFNSNPDCTYDWFVDVMHDAEIAPKQGTYSMPAALNDADKGTDTYCDEKHYHFLGWVVEDEINDDGSLKSGYTLYPAGDAGHTANNKTYYAIWGKD